MADRSLLPSGYGRLLNDLKARVRAAQVKAARSVNRELITLYWDIGKTIVEAQKGKGYGKQVVEHLASDLQKEFPSVAGFSAQNIWRMRSFYRMWAGKQQKLSQPVRESLSPILQQPVRELSHHTLPQPVAESASAPPEPMASLPWGHNLALLHKHDPGNGYARAALLHAAFRRLEPHRHLRNAFKESLCPD